MKFKLTIIKIEYSFKANWDKDKNLDFILEKSSEEAVFYFNKYDDLIKKLFKEEVKKESKIHGDLIQICIDTKPNNTKYNSEELIDYVLFKNDINKYDFIMVGIVDIISNYDE